MIIDEDLRKRFEEILKNKSMGDALGMVYEKISKDEMIATMPVNENTIQPMGILHGGASCTLAETVGSAAANYCIDQSKKVCVGLEINVNHIKSVRGGFVIGKASPLHLGKTTQVWDIQIRTEQNVLVAVSRLTLAVLEKNR